MFPSFVGNMLLTPTRVASTPPCNFSGAMNLRNLLLVLALATLFFSVVPQLDLWMANQLYTPDTRFFLAKNALVLFVYHGVEWVTALALLTAIVVLLGASLKSPALFHDQRRNAVFFLLVVALGPGLVVNGLFKEHWGRARPAEITHFGGDQQYTPPLRPANQCDSNCSFSCGHASMGFAFLAFGYMFPRRRRSWFAIGIMLGLTVGLGRMMQGRHFFSDVIFSGIFVSMTTYALHALFEQLQLPSSRVARIYGRIRPQKPLPVRT